jgi:hypothetical protein
MSKHPSSRTSRNTDGDDDERRRVADELGARLRARGVRLDGRETGEQLANLLDAVETFEGAVEAHGGDLMVDEPVRSEARVSPDNRAFVLPVRREGESVAALIGRIAEATAHARQVHGR